MGIITIEVSGSFRERPRKQFSALSGGHALAEGEAIKWLSEHLLPKAIQQDHLLHSQGESPGLGFGRKEEE